MTRQRAELVSAKMVRRKEWLFDSPEQCRERRRRRIEMRRARWSCSGHYYLPARDHRQHNSDHHERTCLLSDYVQRRQDNNNNNNINLNYYAEEEDGILETETEAVGRTHVVMVQPAVLVPRYLLNQNPMPEFGTISIIRRPDQIQISMDDYGTVLVKEDFCRLQFDDVLGGRPMHFFGVYDGHGHPHVAMLCKEWMHQVVEEELRRVSDRAGGAAGDGNMRLTSKGVKQRQEKEAKWPDLVLIRKALERSFQRMHRLAQDSCSCGNIGHTCGCKPNINALPVAGSTAVVAILTARHIVIANCGSIHAVLGRAGSPFPLSHDHKVERLDEQESMRAVDGRISYHNDVRVYGILNMSHGDQILKPVVTLLEPHISIIEREAGQDECLILANDGFWDVIPDDMACRVASTCLRDGGNPISPAATATVARNLEHFCHPNSNSIDDDGEEEEEEEIDESEMGDMLLSSSKSHHAASVLCRLALARGSHGDMSLMVVDLKSG